MAEQVTIPVKIPRPNTAIERFVYSTLIAIFDTLDVVLPWARPFDKKTENRPIESDQWDDAEIWRRFTEPEGMPPDFRGGRKIGDHTFVKATRNCFVPHLEVTACQFARTHTSIPIPRIRRTIKDEEGYTYLVMDHTPGERLDHVWPSLSIWTKLWVALSLRRYIRQLRQLNSLVPGPLADSPQICDTQMFGERPCGPFPDYASLSAFYNYKLNIAKKVTIPDGHGNTIRCAHPDTKPFDDSRPLVFVHGDLRMHNIIFGSDGRLWLLGWGMSGFYPPWFEYVSMVYAAENFRAPDAWSRLVPFIADPLFKHMRWIDGLGVALIAYR